MTTLLRCQTCHAWQPVPAAIPRAAFICDTCTPQNSTPHLAPIWRLVEAMRDRVGIAAVWVGLCVLAVAGMGLAIAMR